MCYTAPPALTPRSPLQAPREMTRVHTGALRCEGNEVVSVGVSRYQLGSEAPPSGSVLATRQRSHGHDTVELVPGVASSRTDIRTAIREGLIRETYPGSFEDMKAPAEGTPQDAPQEQQALTEEQFFSNPEENKIWSDAIEPLSQPSYDRAVSATVAALVSGKDSFESVAKSLAEANGMDPADAQELVDTGHDWHKRTLTADLVKQGLVTPENAEDFYQAARSNPRLERALLEVAIEGKTSEFRAMALQWKRQASTRTHEALAGQLARSGMESAVDPSSGDIMVKRGSGPWVKFSSL